MKGWSVSRKGKRELHIRKRVRFLPLFLIAAMLSGMLLTSSVGAKGGPADSYDQVVDGGKTVYYDSQGKETGDPQNYTVSVNKTVTQGIKENEFKVDLTVGTTTDYQTVQKSLDSAVIAVVDVSGSMLKCVGCDLEEQWHQNAGHVFESRFDAAKKVLIDFLVKYAEGAGDASAWIYIVAYDDWVMPAMSGWTNVSGMSRAKLTEYVNDTNNLFKPTIGGTNAPGGLEKALDLLKKQQKVPTNRCTVISLTDGQPNITANECAIPDAYISRYNEVVNYLNSYPNTFFNFTCWKQVAQYSFAIRGTGAPLYSVLLAPKGMVEGKPVEQLAEYAKMVSTGSYSAQNAEQLDANFSDIVKQITEAKPDTVTDTLPSWFTADSTSFEGDYADGNLSYEGNNIFWTLAGATPSASNTYKLSYTMMLNNLTAGAPAANEAAPVNETAPVFSYYLYKTTNGGPVIDSVLYKVRFAIPTVKSYDGEVSFYKTDPQGVVITKTLAESSRFKLSSGSWSSEMANDGDGKVTFYNVPSGHTYQLEELKAPAGHEKGTSTYSIDVAWGAAANSQIPQGVVKAADKVTVLAASGSRVVNKYLTGSKDITVQKTWIDTTEDYKNQSVTFNIYKSGDNTTPVKSGTMTIANATVPGGKTWKVTVTVPGKDAETGKELEYSVKETPIPGYTATYDGLNITNVAAPRTETVTITKVWRVPMPDEPEQATVDEATPENAQEAQTQDDTQEAQVQEMREGETINAAAVATPPDAEITLILNSTDGTHKPFGNPHTLKANEATKKEVNGEYVYETKITVENVPVLADNGKPYTYRVEEAAMTGFHHVGTDMPNGTTFEVTNASDELLTTNVPFHKHWEGDEGHTSARVPVTVVLYANDGTDEKEARRAILTAEDKLGTNESVWAGSFDNLPRYVDDDVTKAKIVYRFEEITEVSGYLTSYDGIDIINTWNETSFRVTKNWVKPESAVTPSVTFELYRSDNDQKPYRTYTMPKEESSYTFADLPLYSTDKQTKYTYTVKEVVPTGYTSAQVGADFTNTIKQVYDVTVQGAIEWDLRGEDENVKPAEVLVQLYAGDKPCVYPADYSDVTLRGEDVTRVAKASEGWTYKFEKAQRYTNGLTADIAYSVRELGADGTPAPDVSTVQFQSVVDAPGTLRSFGAHYREVTYDNAKSTFTANIFNHTDAEVAAYRIDRVYNYTLDGSTTAKSVPGTVEYHQPGTELSVNTEDYIRFDGKTYAFSAGMVSVTVDGSTEMFPVLKAGANTIRLEKTDRVYVVTLEYALSETTPPYVPDDPNPPKPSKPTEPTDPTPPPTTEPTTPPTEPTTPPTTEPTTPPTDPTTPPKPPKDPDIRPNPPVLTPEEEEKVDEVIKDVTEYPEHIIKDKDSFEEMFPEVSIEDLPPPLYWGPEFAIVDVPVYEEIVAIDSELVPLGNLPQTGSDLRATATRTALVGVGAMAAAGTIALGGWLVLRRKYREE